MKFFDRNLTQKQSVKQFGISEGTIERYRIELNLNSLPYRSVDKTDGSWSKNKTKKNSQMSSLTSSEIKSWKTYSDKEHFYGKGLYDETFINGNMTEFIETITNSPKTQNHKDLSKDKNSDESNRTDSQFSHFALLRINFLEKQKSQWEKQTKIC